MEPQILSMSEHEQCLGEALREAVSIVSRIEERYRDTAFPIILQFIIKEAVSTHIQHTSEQHTSKSRLSSRMSVNEFFLKAAPDSHPERLVCAAYYLLHAGKAEQFTMANILDTYTKLRQTKPGNPADVINKCIRKAHITDGPAPVNGQKSWVITPEGEKYVEEELLSGNKTNNS
jgi:hypothetical protein